MLFFPAAEKCTTTPTPTPYPPIHASPTPAVMIAPTEMLTRLHRQQTKLILWGTTKAFPTPSITHHLPPMPFPPNHSSPTPAAMTASTELLMRFRRKSVPRRTKPVFAFSSSPFFSFTWCWGGSWDGCTANKRLISFHSTAIDHGSRYTGQGFTRLLELLACQLLLAFIRNQSSGDRPEAREGARRSKGRATSARQHHHHQLDGGRIRSIEAHVLNSLLRGIAQVRNQQLCYCKLDTVFGSCHMTPSSRYHPATHCSHVHECGWQCGRLHLCQHGQQPVAGVQDVSEVGLVDGCTVHHLDPLEWNGTTVKGIHRQFGGQLIKAFAQHPSIQEFTHPLTQTLPPSLTHSLTHSLTCSPAPSPTYPPIHPLSH